MPRYEIEFAGLNLEITSHVGADTEQAAFDGFRNAIKELLKTPENFDIREVDEDDDHIWSLDDRVALGPEPTHVDSPIHVGPVS